MARQESRTQGPRSLQLPSDQCRHHWVIETPNGPTVNGVCRLCGVEREFRTSSDDYIREDAVAPLVA